MKRNTNLFLSDIIEAAMFIMEFTKDYEYNAFIQDEKTKSAVLRKLEVIGEAAKRVFDEIKAKHSHIPWKDCVLWHRLQISMANRTI